MRFNINFDSITEVFDCTLEIFQGSRVEKQRMKAPRFVIEQQFASLVEQATNTVAPIKLRLSRIVPVWSQFEQRWIDREIDIVFMNNAWANNYGES